MDDRQGRAVGGSCLGGMLGILLGGLIGYMLIEPPAKNDLLPITTGFFHFFGSMVQLGAVLAGAGMGGVGGGSAARWSVRATLPNGDAPRRAMTPTTAPLPIPTKRSLGSKLASRISNGESKRGPEVVWWLRRMPLQDFVLQGP